MGYQFHALFVRDGSLEALDAALPDAFSGPDVDDTLPFEIVATGQMAPDCAAALVGGWLVFWDAAGALAFGESGEDFRRRIIRDGEALVVAAENMTDEYAVHYHQGGERVRAIAYRERSEVVLDEGRALAAEKKLKLPKWGRDEGWVFTIVERITKIDTDALEAIEYARVALG